MIPGEGHPRHPISAGVTTPRHNSAMTTEGSRIRPFKVLDPSPMAACAQLIHQNRRIEDKEVTHRGRRIRASPIPLHQGLEALQSDKLTKRDMDGLGAGLCAGNRERDFYHTRLI